MDKKSNGPGAGFGFSWNEKAKLNKTIARYNSGSILLGQAAKEANLTTLEFMDYMSTIGFKSKYSFADFQKAQEQLDKFLNYKPE